MKILYKKYTFFIFSVTLFWIYCTQPQILTQEWYSEEWDQDPRTGIGLCAAQTYVLRLGGVGAELRSP